LNTFSNLCPSHLCSFCFIICIFFLLNLRLLLWLWLLLWSYSTIHLVTSFFCH
jgi:hypothetical protein